MQNQNVSQTILAELSLADVGATKAFAARFSPLLKSGDVVAFDGALGAGKTELCRAIIQALGFTDDVPSPTFTLVQTYEPTASMDPEIPTIWHMDMYRLEDPDEAFELGIEEAFATAVSLIEWPAKLGPHLPPGFLTLRLDIEANGRTRKLTVIGDAGWQARLGKILFHD